MGNWNFLICVSPSIHLCLCPEVFEDMSAQTCCIKVRIGKQTYYISAPVHLGVAFVLDELAMLRHVDSSALGLVLEHNSVAQKLRADMPLVQILEGETRSATVYLVEQTADGNWTPPHAEELPPCAGEGPAVLPKAIVDFINEVRPSPSLA